MFTVTLNCIPSLQHWIHRLGLLPLPPTVPIFSSLQFSSIQFSHSVVSDSLRPREMQHARPPCPLLSPWGYGYARCHELLCMWSIPAPFSLRDSLFKLMSIESVMSSDHLILCCPFSSCPHSFPVSGFFPMSRLFTSGGQRIGASVSASVLLENNMRNETEPLYDTIHKKSTQNGLKA